MWVIGVMGESWADGSAHRVPVGLILLDLLVSCARKGGLIDGQPEREPGNVVPVNWVRILPGSTEPADLRNGWRHERGENDRLKHAC